MMISEGGSWYALLHRSSYEFREVHRMELIVEHLVSGSDI